ncbi:MAG TPA: 3-oxoacyl-ACP reductase family protein [Anaeromyxobacteraceae bacterium]|nr:3-oxoacyl-ACP reductase family protein [Anaeromyxobacteraceae bacterium]
MTKQDESIAPPVAIVTGGSRGIGKAVVELLAGKGMTVHFTYLASEEAARALAEKIQARGGVARGWRVDARDVLASRAFVESVVRETQRVDLLVNNAAVKADYLLPMMSDTDWSTVLATSLNGLFGITKATATQMMRQRSGRIVNLTSVSGLVGFPGQTNYCAAKSAVIGFTRSLAKELAGWGIPVNAVAPGYVDTDMSADLTGPRRVAAIEKVPMRRFSTAEEIAGVVAYLAMGAPNYLTGQTIVIDGGLSS